MCQLAREAMPTKKAPGRSKAKAKASPAPAKEVSTLFEQDEETEAYGSASSSVDNRALSEKAKVTKVLKATQGLNF